MDAELRLRLEGLCLEEKEAEVRWWNWIHGTPSQADQPAQAEAQADQPAQPTTPTPRVTRNRSRSRTPARDPVPHRPVFRSDDTIREMLIEWINL